MSTDEHLVIRDILRRLDDLEDELRQARQDCLDRDDRLAKRITDVSLAPPRRVR